MKKCSYCGAEYPDDAVVCAVDRNPLVLKRTYDKAGLRRIYEEAKMLFLRGKHGQALENFKSIYEVDIAVGDVVSIINDYWDMPKDKWIAKYEARFRAQL